MTKKLFLSLLLLLLVSFVFSIDDEEEEAQHEWRNFKLTYGKEYPSAEAENKARQHYFDNKKFAIKAGVRAATSGETKEPAVYGVNQFADLSFEEFSAEHLGYLTPHSPSEPSKPTYNLNPQDVALTAAVQEVDWSKTKYLSAPRQQGSCGSCWTFAAASALEALYAIKTGNTGQYFSTQQLVDCVSQAGGCNGGHPYYVYKYVAQNGIVFDSKYPYLLRQGACQAPSSPDFKITSQANANGNEAGILAQLVKQPLTVGVYASQAWMTYKRGVMAGSDCSQSNQANHAVVLVGVTQDYWIVRNSWGTSWGEGGYIRLQRGNTCLIMNDVTWPVIVDSTPDPPPTPTPPTCVDKITDCATVKTLGFCDANDYLRVTAGKELCAKTCDLCSTTCKDIASNCNDNLAFCDNEMVLKYCQKSCAACT